jgi:DNA-binding GntR family transcriptional regulator
MAPDPATQERIYLAIKGDYLAGHFKAFERIDIKAISDRHMSSTTPVREVLARLVGEKLFEHRPEGGFRMLLPDHQRLADMYAHHQQLVGIALSLSDPQKLRQVMRACRETIVGVEPNDVPRCTAILFNSIAWTSSNFELMDQVQSMNDRLHHARVAELQIIRRIAGELNAITRNGIVDIRNTVSRRIAKYHLKRIASSRAITEKF